MGQTWRSCWQSGAGNWCCHLRGLSKIRQQKIGKRLPGWISLNVSCDFQANGVRLWCNSMRASIHPVFYQQFRLVGCVRVCSLAHLRPLTDSWVSFGSVRLEPLSYTGPLLPCTDVTPSWPWDLAPVEHFGDAADWEICVDAQPTKTKARSPGECLQHLVEFTPWEIKVCPVWR